MAVDSPSCWNYDKPSTQQHNWEYLPTKGNLTIIQVSQSHDGVLQPQIKISIRATRSLAHYATPERVLN